METNSHILKITGTAELPEELHFGSDYKLQLVGAFTSIKEKDNEDGSVDRIYSVRLSQALIQDERKTILTKDKTRWSQKMRYALMKEHAAMGTEQEFEDWYEHIMPKLIANLPEIIDNLENG